MRGALFFFSVLPSKKSLFSVGGGRGIRRRALVCDEFDEMFRGDFDNYAQVLGERAAGVEASDPGGHEHVHCSLRRLDGDVLACYYLDADPSKVFRLRIYSFRGAAMQIWRPTNSTEAHALVTDLPERWPDIDLDPINWEQLDGCDVLWGEEKQQPQRGGEDEEERGETTPATKFKGTMPNGGCTVASQFDPTRLVDVKDELFLDHSALCVDDRGYDRASGRLLYGSIHGVPYTMRRVSVRDYEEGKDSGEDCLHWTLGAAFRDPGLFDRKMQPLRRRTER